MSKTKPPGINKPNELTRLFAEFAGNAPAMTLVIHQPFLKLCKGDHLAALLLSQIIYWQGKTTDADGWFSHSYEEWHAELYLSQYQVSRLVRGETNEKRKRKGDVFMLQSVGVETKRKRSRFHKGAATIHYRVNWHTLGKALKECFAEDDAPPVVNIVDNESMTNINIVDNDAVNIVDNNAVNNASNVYKDYPETTAKKKNAANAAAPRANPKRKPSRTPRQHELFKGIRDAIVKAFGYEEGRIGRKMEAVIAVTGWELVDMKYLPGHVPHIFRYCRDKLSTFTVAALSKYAADARNALIETYGRDIVEQPFVIDDAAEGTPPEFSEDEPPPGAVLHNIEDLWDRIAEDIDGARVAGKR